MKNAGRHQLDGVLRLSRRRRGVTSPSWCQASDAALEDQVPVHKRQPVALEQPHVGAFLGGVDEGDAGAGWSV